MNIASARRAAEFVNVIKTDSFNRVTKALVPGHKNKTYEVKIKRTSKGMLSCCKCGKNECPGNQSAICYHVLAALVSSSTKLKPRVRLSFCETKEAAQALVNIAGRMFSLKSQQSGKKVWVVAVQDIDPNELLC